MSVAIACNVGVLCFFKYFNFFLDSFSRLANLFNYDCVYTPLDIILPIGISFYTFQGLSYVIDIYRQKIEPTNDIVGFCAFIAFFPQLVAGPIERAKNLLPQFCQEKQFNYDQIRSGLFLIAVGLFRKVVIADRIAIYVDSVYGNLANVQGFCVLLAIVLFAFQLYIDFSAYSQIAIGTARL
ncbi:MAG: MBOAT family protein, partial [Bacteroidales bacterium]|nr:MBOAT family protein [Bacteroidales bacterium]